MKNTSIDINQRIPLEILHTALLCSLNDTYNNEYILEQISSEYSGENRQKKALRIINKVIKNSPLSLLIEENKSLLISVLRNKNDRNLILISLLNSAFPFSFFVLNTFGKYFKAQDVINSDTIKKAVSKVYGGNRATENGIYSVVPMFLEAGLFTRPKVGIYEISEPLRYSPLAVRFFKESLKGNLINESLLTPQPDNPYFTFLPSSLILD